VGGSHPIFLALGSSIFISLIRLLKARHTIDADIIYVHTIMSVFQYPKKRLDILNGP
jgi:hypothetical protein